MRAAYGDAIAEVFLISAIVGLVALVAILFIKERPLRRTVDVRPEPAELAGDAPDAGVAAMAGATAAGSGEHGLHQEHGNDAVGAAPSAGTGIVDLDREFIEVLSRDRADPASPMPPASGPGPWWPRIGPRPPTSYL